MSALRIAHPGKPVVFVDLGPGTGRVQGANLSGSLVQSRPKDDLPIPSTSPKRRAQMAAYRARIDTSCGRVMPITKEVCARRLGHRDDCRTAAHMERKAMQRRAA